MKIVSGNLLAAAVASLWIVGSLGPVAHAAETALPHLVTRDGRHALIVDGKPSATFPL
jgi:hypothetical protein